MKQKKKHILQRCNGRVIGKMIYFQPNIPIIFKWCLLKTMIVITLSSNSLRSCWDRLWTPKKVWYITWSDMVADKVVASVLKRGPGYYDLAWYIWKSHAEYNSTGFYITRMLIHPFYCYFALVKLKMSLFYQICFPIMNYIKVLNGNMGILKVALSVIPREQLTLSGHCFR